MAVLLLTSSLSAMPSQNYRLAWHKKMKMKLFTTLYFYFLMFLVQVLTTE